MLTAACSGSPELRYAEHNQYAGRIRHARRVGVPGPSGTPDGRPTSSPGLSAGAPTWTRILRQPVDGQHIVTQQRKYLVTRASDDAGTTTVTDRANHRVVVRHAPAAGFVAQSPVVIDDRWALIEEIRSDGPSPEIRAYRYDLTTGKRTDLAKQNGLPRSPSPRSARQTGPSPVQQHRQPATAPAWWSPPSIR